MSDDLPIKARKQLYSDPFLTVAEHRYEHSDRKLRYYIKEEPEFAVVGAVTEAGEIVMVRQFRPGPKRFMLDLPGGMVEQGDSAVETARKELLEETGYAGDLTYVTSCYPMAYSTAKKHILLAKNCVKVAEAEVEANMIAEPVLVSRQAFAELLQAGEVLDLDAMLLLAQALGIPYELPAT